MSPHSITRSFDEAQKCNIRRTLWYLASPSFIPAGFYQSITVVAQLSIPILVLRLLSSIEEYPNQKLLKEGLHYALLIFFASMTNSLATHRQRYLALESGVIVRSAIISVIYDHVMRLRPEGKIGLTTGEVTNLVSIDAQKVCQHQTKLSRSA